MSWLWRRNSGNSTDNDKESFDKVDSATDGLKDAKSTADTLFADSKNDESSKREAGSLPGFDSAALERAAVAARELEGLKYAGEAVEIAKLKESRREKQAIAKAEENKVRQKAMEVERSRAIEQERRQTLQADHKLKQEQAYYSDQLSRKRHQDQLQQQASMREQQRKRDEEFQLKVESMKRQTAEYEAKLRKETERARVAAEMEGKAEKERKNWDLHMQRAKMETKEFRTTVLEGVREAGSIIGSGLSNYLQDPQKLAGTVGLGTALALGVYSARTGTGVLGRFIEARLGKPPLVRETSRVSLLRAPFASFRSFLNAKTDPMEGVIVQPKLADRLGSLAVSTRNTKRNGAPFRHALFYGPPGTGKTLFAKKLAQSSGMDFAILTGSDVAPLGRDAVTEIHKLFDWAKTSRKGLIVFVDEADAFLRKRTYHNMSEDQRNALNAFLYRTGTESNDFMMVYATNEPEDLDRAINDRTDEIIEFGLPAESEREKLLIYYFDKYVINADKNGSRLFRRSEPVKLDGVDIDLVKSLVGKTKDFSGREITKLAIAWAAAAHGSGNATLTKELFQTVLDRALNQKKFRQEMEQVNR